MSKKQKKGGASRPSSKGVRPSTRDKIAAVEIPPTATPAPEPEKQLGGVTGKGFMPGESGNPGGRVTRLSTMISQAIKAQLGEIPDGEKETNADLIVKHYLEAIRKEAKGGVISKAGVALLKEFGDRSEGKPRQTLELTGDMLARLTDEQLAYVIATGELPATVANA